LAKLHQSVQLLLRRPVRGWRNGEADPMTLYLALLQEIMQIFYIIILFYFSCRSDVKQEERQQQQQDTACDVFKTPCPHAPPHKF
jgi:hypothetical protein